jgi:hypothetical protein
MLISHDMRSIKPLTNHWIGAKKNHGSHDADPVIKIECQITKSGEIRKMID